MNRITRTGARWQWMALVAAAALGLQARAQRNFSGTVETDPEKERQTFKVADGFEVNLFAADPILAKPIQMSFDVKGRLWVACSETYPQVLPGQKANDRILVLEDTDGDGKADKTTVFAEGLLIPTGVEPAGNGAFVVDSTDLVFLEDTDGDGKADKRTVFLSGFGTEDTHHMVHTVRWHYDGRLYFNQSIYIHSHLETPYGPRRLNGSGIWRYHPGNQTLEVFQRGLVNPWGHHHDRHGVSFATDGAGGEGINYVVPRASYMTAVGASRILPGLNPGSPKHCGLELVSGRNFPDDWQGDAITCDFRGHRVCRFKLTREGSGFISTQMPELVVTNHPAFRPIDVRMGMDGALYMADWFNPIIQHGEVDFRDPRRDKTHGRIWRVTAKGRPVAPVEDLTKKSNAELLAMLGDAETPRRHNARRVLVERGKDKVMADLKRFIRDIPADNELLLLDAVWTLQAFDQMDSTLVARLLASKDARFRAAGVRVLAYHEEMKGITSPLWVMKKLGEAVRDPDGLVRLEAVSALGRIGNEQSAWVALGVRSQPMDRWLDYALWLCLQETYPVWLASLDKGQPTGVSAADFLFALQQVDSPEVGKALGRLVAGDKIQPESLVPVLAHLTRVGGPEELKAVWAKVPSVPGDSQAGLLDGLAAAALEKGRKPAGIEGVDAMLLLATGPAAQTLPSRARLVGAWKLANAYQRLTELLKEKGISDPAGRAALDGLLHLGDPRLKEVVVAGIDAETNAAAKPVWLATLARLDANAAATRAAALLAGKNEPSTLRAVLEAVLGAKGGEAALVKVMESGKGEPEAARALMRELREMGGSRPQLEGALRDWGKLKNARAEWGAKEKTALLGKLASADPARGENLYRGTAVRCLACHAISGAGGLVGPDLTSIGASAQPDYLLDSLLTPDKQIKEGYHGLVVSTDDGKVLTGIPVRNSDKELVLRQADGAEITVQKARIEEQKQSASLMPAGLVDDLTDQELADLVRFLSELGKQGAYAPSTTPYVRTWEVLEPGPAASQWVARGMRAGPPAGLKWSPVYSRVEGSLPLGGLPAVDGQRVLRAAGAPPAGTTVWKLTAPAGNGAPEAKRVAGRYYLAVPATTPEIKAVWQKP